MSQILTLFTRHLEPKPLMTDSDGFGDDQIEDFDSAEDLIEISLNLLGSTPATASAVIADFASVNGNDTIFDFGGDRHLYHRGCQ